MTPALSPPPIRASSKASSRARTARASEWGHTAIFSDLLDDEDDEEGGRGGGGRSRLGDRSGRAPASAAGRGAKGGRLRDTEEDPMDLLGQGAARDLMRVSNSRKVLLPRHHPPVYISVHAPVHAPYG